MSFFKKTLGAAVVAGAALGAQAGQENIGVEKNTLSPQTSAEQQSDYLQMEAKWSSVTNELRKINFSVAGNVTPTSKIENKYIIYLKDASSVSVIKNNERMFTEQVSKESKPADFAVQINNKIQKIESYTVKPFDSKKIFEEVVRQNNETFEETSKRRALEEEDNLRKSFELVKLVSADMGLGKNWNIRFDAKKINDQNMPILGEIIVTSTISGVTVTRDIQRQTNLIDLARTLSNTTKNLDADNVKK